MRFNTPIKIALFISSLLFVIAGLLFILQLVLTSF